LLIVKNETFIGDALLSSIVFSNEDNLLDKFSEVYFLVSSKSAGLFADYEGLLNFITYDVDKYKWNIFYRIRTINRIRKINPALCINLNVRLGVTQDEIPLLSGAGKIYGASSSSKRYKRLLGTRIDNYYTQLTGEYKGEFNRQCEILKLLLNNDLERKGKIFLKDERVKQAGELLRGNPYYRHEAPLIVSNPFSSLDKKNWPVEKFKELFRRLANERGYNVVILGSADKKEFSLKAFSDIKAINFVGQLPILDSIAVLTYADLYIGQDSGFSHAAKILDKNLIGILNGVPHVPFFPYGDENKRQIYIENRMDCFGCEWKCIYNEPKCITEIPVDAVYNKACEIIDSCSKGFPAV